MNTVNGWNFLPFNEVSHAYICRNHAVFNHLFRMATVSWSYVIWMSILIASDFRFTAVERNCAFCCSMSADRIRTIRKIRKQGTKMFILCFQFLVSIQNPIDIVIGHTFR